ncbi:MAG: hypothetical protein RRY36_08140 [Bacteroidaceae bacterium]
MTQDEMKERYNYLYDKMKGSKEPRKMMIFGMAEKTIFHKLCSKDSNLAKEWIDMLEGICWYNYLSEAQSKMLVAGIINQDKTTGPKWNMDVLFTTVEKLGGKIEDEPYYNKYALYVIMNAKYSDHAKSTAEDMGYATIAEVPADKMALSMYKKATESLCDLDRMDFVERYYWMELNQQ